jgi:hypothetical protein
MKRLSQTEKAFFLVQITKNKKYRLVHNILLWIKGPFSTP